MKPKAQNSKDVLKYIDPSKPVRVYRNLNHHCLSVKQNGIVQCHAQNVILENVTFIISKKSQNRVRVEKRKNVHAFVQGMVIAQNPTLKQSWVELYYNPYTCESFIEKHTKAIVASADFCDLEADPNVRSEILASNIKYYVK